MDPVVFAEKGLLPDALVRRGIRHQLAQRLDQEQRGNLAGNEERRRRFRQQLRDAAITLNTGEANRQHYEVPPALFELMLGPRLKYSSCLWSENVSTLAAAEEAMLQCYVERAQLADGQRILDMGCGWGSFTLWAAERFPHAHITAVSNSHQQRSFIQVRAAERGLANIQVLTCDIAVLELSERFDRIVTIEMMEHVRNYRQLLAKASAWLEPEGLMFVHIFCHAFLHYPFDDGWMTDHFFSGGQMPAFDTLLHFSEHMRIVDSWRVSGGHYGKTLEAWLQRVDANRGRALAILGDSPDPKLQLQRWRIFLLACAELFGYRGGREWFVGHYLMTPGRPAD